VNPIFIISLAPVMAALWVQLGRRNLDPSIPAKFGLGLLFLALGFVVMMGASTLVAAGHKVWPSWLLSIYLIHTFGELCLSPVGLSSVTKLSPPRLVGQMLGTWFVASSLGSLLAGKIAGDFDETHLQDWPALCRPMVIIPAIVGLLLLIFARPINRLMAGVK
jgi:POT family proton-dependent oligopeptide transporter